MTFRELQAEIAADLLSYKTENGHINATLNKVENTWNKITTTKKPNNQKEASGTPQKYNSHTWSGPKRTRKGRQVNQPRQRKNESLENAVCGQCIVKATNNDGLQTVKSN